MSILGKLFGPTQGFQAREMQNEAMRMELERGRRQEAAAARLGGLLGPDPLMAQLGAESATGQILPLPPGFEEERALERRAGILDAATELAPGAMAERVISEMFPAPQTGRMADLMRMHQQVYGPDAPVTLESISDLQKSLSAGGADTGVMDNLRAVLMGLQARGLEQDMRREAEEETASMERLESSLNESLDLSWQMWAANEGLRGTSLETGGVGMDFRRDVVNAAAEGLRFFNFNDMADDLESDVSKLNSFSKNAAIFVGQLAQQAAESGMAPNSRMELQQLIERAANKNIDADTNNDIIGRGIRLMLNEADRNGIEVRNRPRLEVLQRQLLEGRRYIFDTVEDFESDLPRLRRSMRRGDPFVVRGQVVPWDGG